VQPAPVGAQRHQRQPGQHQEPAVALRHPHQQSPEGPGRQREHDNEDGLPAQPRPVQQDQRQHGPDQDVVQARIAQDALAQRLAQDVHLLHQQHQDGQRRHRAAHADAGDELPGLGARAQPARAGQGQQAGGQQRAQQQRHQQRAAGGDGALDAVGPGRLQVELEAGDEHEQAHRPPRQAVQRLHDRGLEHRGVQLGEGGAEQPRPEQDAGDDLHHHQRCPVVGAAQPPQRVGHEEDHRHRDEEQLDGVEGGGGHGAAIVPPGPLRGGMTGSQPYD
jgi:hypothetical protein